ncbi:hypothetical protein GFH30_06365 [Acinetobacter wanghuae]|uniref:Secreted protein n=1 Tax=Acinetobacter wanghuae TaxID=2662362 RepID=A0ABX6D2F4_9GAMM|nr:hypothetical protein [Acinetobacter wanghuae]QGA11035.1 hypothetical protein GFH30_06365 [Acinetobacter wanghuae]
MWQFLLGFIIAWVVCCCYTHICVANECERLGGFFVGSKTYKCVVIEDESQTKEKLSAVLHVNTPRSNQK